MQATDNRNANHDLCLFLESSLLGQVRPCQFRAAELSERTAPNGVGVSHGAPSFVYNQALSDTMIYPLIQNVKVGYEHIRGGTHSLIKDFVGASATTTVVAWIYISTYASAFCHDGLMCR